MLVLDVAIVIADIMVDFLGPSLGRSNMLDLASMRAYSTVCDSGLRRQATQVYPPQKMFTILGSVELESRCVPR